SSCSRQAPALELIKLPSATHGWENGQHFVSLAIGSGGTSREITFTTPDAKAANVPPAYYMMFYVDCKGKPSVAGMGGFEAMAKEPYRRGGAGAPRISAGLQRAGSANRSSGCSATRKVAWAPKGKWVASREPSM